MMAINEIKVKEEKDILCLIKANTLKIYSVYNMSFRKYEIYLLLKIM